LLVASQCYLQSGTLECGSCHDVHVRERENLTVFASRCMNCHKEEHKGGWGKQFLINNCIDCHMPARASARITMLTQTQKDPIADLVRSHYITVYPEETKKRLAARGSH
jgi:hypothetical protein